MLHLLTDLLEIDITTQASYFMVFAVKTANHNDLLEKSINFPIWYLALFNR